MDDSGENWFLDSSDLDSFNILCTLSIFIVNLISVLYVLWSVVPLIEPFKPSVERKPLANQLELSQTAQQIAKAEETSSSRSSPVQSG